MLKLKTVDQYFETILVDCKSALMFIANSIQSTWSELIVDVFNPKSELKIPQSIIADTVSENIRFSDFADKVSLDPSDYPIAEQALKNHQFNKGNGDKAKVKYPKTAFVEEGYDITIFFPRDFNNKFEKVDLKKLCPIFEEKYADKDLSLDMKDVIKAQTGKGLLRSLSASSSLSIPRPQRDVRYTRYDVDVESRSMGVSNFEALPLDNNSKPRHDFIFDINVKKRASTLSKVVAYFTIAGVIICAISLYFAMTGPIDPPLF